MEYVNVFVAQNDLDALLYKEVLKQAEIPAMICPVGEPVGTGVYRIMMPAFSLLVNEEDAERAQALIHDYNITLEQRGENLAAIKDDNGNAADETVEDDSLNLEADGEDNGKIFSPSHHNYRHHRFG
ncbi:MAG TPA: DUF2007 domain-containing protein [Armatimonadota bacterium]|nr:DUF2007 domain-containing protein [Armatimonadota bacterium]